MTPASSLFSTREQAKPPDDPTDRWLTLGPDSVALPERLLLAHSRGQVLFLTGSGVSRQPPSCLPDFRGLVLDVYAKADAAVYAVLRAQEESTDRRAAKRCAAPPDPASTQAETPSHELSDEQAAERDLFNEGNYDVVLGMLERRVRADEDRTNTEVRETVRKILQRPGLQHAAIHDHLVRLSDRGGATAILTTNFDLLLEKAAEGTTKGPLATHTLGGMPRPSRQRDFTGVFHLHGALATGNEPTSDLVLTDEDFGEFYLRRRVVPDLVYDACRLYHVVLVGYTANDPPMRYLLNAILADSARFPDMQGRLFAFVSYSAEEGADPIARAAWRSRGIVPIPYSDADGHRELTMTLKRWAKLFENSPALAPKNEGRTGPDESHEETVTDRLVRLELDRITEIPRSASSTSDKDLFDHLVRRIALRGSEDECCRFAAMLRDGDVDYSWLDAILHVLLDEEQMIHLGADVAGPTQAKASRMASACVSVFVRTRLSDRRTLTWACASLPTKQEACKRSGVRRSLGFRERELEEPWLTAWRMVEETWSRPETDSREDLTLRKYRLRERLDRGENSLSLAEDLAEFVKPWLRQGELMELVGVSSTEPESASSAPPFFRPSLDSVDVSPHLDELQLTGIEDPAFLARLVRALEAVVLRALDLGREIGWQGGDLTLLGGLSSVRYIPATDETTMGDPDMSGIAPSVKLLHAAALRQARVDRDAAARTLRRWQQADDIVHLRLWAAITQEAERPELGHLVPASEVAEFLRRLEDRPFWFANNFPEVARLRALRFSELDARTRDALVERFLRGLPETLLRPGVDPDDRARLSLQLALRELKRIEVGGATLPDKAKRFLDENKSAYPGLSGIESVDDGLLPDIGVGIVREPAATDLDDFEGLALLRELNERLTPP